MAKQPLTEGKHSGVIRRPSNTPRPAPPKPAAPAAKTPKQAKQQAEQSVT